MIDMPDRLDLASQDPLLERKATFRSLFPEAVREDRIDLDVLHRLLGDATDPGSERFGLTWPGKVECIRVIQELSLGTLLPMREQSVSFDTTHNMLIEGENLEVLKLLQKAYYGKIRLIYIDPPYNTGNEFIYPDDFREGLQDYLRYSGQVDDAGFRLIANAETDGRYHSKWLSMMYPRLFLARTLLSNNGLIFVSIGPQELANLTNLMVELFGEENFLGTVTRITKTTSNKGTYFAPSVDYILVAARNSDLVDGFSVQPGADYEKGFKGMDPDGRRYKEVGLYQAALDSRPNQRYWIKCPDGSFCIPPGETFPNIVSDASQCPPASPKDKVWRWSAASYLERLPEITFKKSAHGPLIAQDRSRSEWNVYVKQYLDRRLNEGVLPRDFLSDIPNAQGTKELQDLGLGDDFDFAKPTALVRWTLELAADSDAIVLDFFAGSGTTAQAVMAQNVADGGARRFVLIQLPEPTDRKDFPTIADITRARVARAGERILQAPKQFGAMEPDCGFRAYRLTSSNFAIWESDVDNEETVARQLTMNVDHIIAGSTHEGILTELLLKAGYELTAPVEVGTCRHRRVFRRFRSRAGLPR